jgi:hypothetical protein
LGIGGSRVASHENAGNSNPQVHVYFFHFS